MSVYCVLFSLFIGNDIFSLNQRVSFRKLWLNQYQKSLIRVGESGGIRLMGHGFSVEIPFFTT